MKLRNALIIVLVAALLTYAWELSRRRAEYARRARSNDMFVQGYDDVIEPGADPDQIRHMQYQETMRAYHNMLIHKYEYARDHPWTVAEPDPPRPRSPATDLARGTQ
jgi:FtsZ-interacting cell division protein ZipA